MKPRAAPGLSNSNRVFLSVAGEVTLPHSHIVLIQHNISLYTVKKSWTPNGILIPYHLPKEFLLSTTQCFLFSLLQFWALSSTGFCMSWVGSWTPSGAFTFLLLLLEFGLWTVQRSQQGLLSFKLIVLFCLVLKVCYRKDVYMEITFRFLLHKDSSTDVMIIKR